MSPLDCLKWLALPVAVRGVLVSIQYWRITAVWLREADKLDWKTGRMWFALSWVFRSCAISGYLAITIAIVLTFIFPLYGAIFAFVAYLIKIVASIVDVIACEIFLKDQKKFPIVQTPDIASFKRSYTEMEIDEDEPIALLHKLKRTLDIK